MKKVVVLFFLLAVFTTGCSYEITSSTSQIYQGESKKWIADYKADFSTSFPEKDGKIYVEEENEDHLTITRKNDFDTPVTARHIEISYNDVNGNTCTQTEDSDAPIKTKQFHSGGGSGGISELSDYLSVRENIHKAIMIYSGPSYEMRTNATITVIIRLDGKSETIILTPITDISPLAGVMTQVEEKITQMQIKQRYPEYAEFNREEDLLN